MPNRLKPGQKKLTPEELKKLRHDLTAPFRFKPGVSGNPKGRPPKRPITEEYELAIQECAPDQVCENIGLPRGSTIAKIIARLMAIRASTLSSRSIEAAREMREAIEGKASQSVKIGGDGTPISPPIINVFGINPDGSNAKNK